jgi:hypothetical protein
MGRGEDWIPSGLAGALFTAVQQRVLGLLFGQPNRRFRSAGSDVDVLVISDSLGYADVYAALEGAEQRLARPVSPTVMSREEWRVRRAEPDSFAARIAAQPRLALIGDLDHLR